MPSACLTCRDPDCLNPRPPLLRLTDLRRERSQKKPTQSLNRAFNKRVSELEGPPWGASLSPCTPFDKSDFWASCCDAALIDVALWLLLRVEGEDVILPALPPEGAASLTPGRGLLELEGRSLYLHVLEFLAFCAFYSCSKNLPNVGTVYTFLVLKSELPASCFFDSLPTFCCVFCWSTARGSSTRGRKKRRRKCSNNIFAGISQSA